VSEGNEELFTAEFRHEAVNEFIRDLVSGRIRIKSFFTQAITKEQVGTAGRIYVKFVDEISQYVSAETTIDQRKEIEAELFRKIAYLRAVQMIEDDVPSTQSINQALQAINMSVDSTQELLKQIIVILLDLMKKIDK